MKTPIAVLLLSLAVATPAAPPRARRGGEGEAYVLIRIAPTRLEVVSAALGMRNDPETWRPVVLEIR